MKYKYACATAVLGTAILSAGFYCFERYRVKGTSMQDTLHAGDRMFVLDKSFCIISKEDIILADVPDQSDPVVKRVVGCPDDFIFLCHNKSHGPSYFHRDKKEDCALEVKTLKDDEYFLVGDNYSVSVDSREFGPIHYSQILGKVVYVMHTSFEENTASALNTK